MIKLGDPNEIGGVDEIGFVNLMKELGLWGKSKEGEKEQEGFLKQEEELIKRNLEA